MSRKTTTVLVAMVLVGGALAAEVACSAPDSDGGSAASSISIDGNIVVPANVDLIYDVSEGLSGGRDPVGVDRVSFRRAGTGRAVTIAQERGDSSTTALLSATTKGYVTYARSASPRFTLDIFSVPASSSDATWSPLDGPIINDQLAAVAAADGTMATVDVHELRAVDALERPEGRVYRAIFDGRRRVVENAPTVSPTTNADWAYRNVIVTSGIADYFVPRGSAEIVLVRAAEYRLVGDDIRLTPTDSIESLRATALSPDTYLTLRCLRGTSPAAKSALAAWSPSGLAIDACIN